MYENITLKTLGILLLAFVVAGVLSIFSSDPMIGAAPVLAAFAYIASPKKPAFPAVTAMPHHSISITRSWRIVLVSMALWVLGVQLWGEIWEWQSQLTYSQFIALNLSEPLLAVAALLGKTWIDRAP